MVGMSSIGNLFRGVIVATSLHAPHAARPLSSASEAWNQTLGKLERKFLGNTNAGAPAFRQDDFAKHSMGAHASRLPPGNMLFQRGVYTGIAALYEKTTGKLMDYDRMKVNAVAASVSWAFQHGLLPDKASNIVDIGAAHGGATVQLGKKYQEASILALDPDPQSAKFIEEKVKGGDSVLKNPERLATFSGTFQEAFSAGKVKENSADLVVMQAVAPYLSDEALADTLKGIHTALASGGKVVLSCYGDEHFSKNDAKSTLTLRSDMQMLDMFEKAGLSVECIGNTLQAGDGKSYQKNTREMSDVMEQKSMPGHPDGKYWHSVYIVATKP
ncbi:hypothetical protein BZL41_25800 [Pseudomonas sp. PIC25]|uniref:class I SAM-dependent methyltransferase n=1 Tax=Pseudomonas sp. PIC25 TaxID=1958773 RepID=UPI000BABB944|nr:class I SAM-dependent methyltransferase [Pseudomonas sp. PIC25]PAU52341.1 hypothetical protein BZL41_25800 [Pseudomonas sp. PIC25]